MTTPPRVFIFHHQPEPGRYSSPSSDSRVSDTALCAEFVMQLDPLVKQKRIVVWSRASMLPGTRVMPEIQKQLGLADAVVLLVSGEFLASTECMEIAKQALERCQANNLPLNIVVLRPCMIEQSLLAGLTLLPADGKPITGRSGLRETLWSEIGRSIMNQLFPKDSTPAPADVKPKLAVAPRDTADSKSKVSSPKDVSISWLHLSDLHLGMDPLRWRKLWPNVREDFSRDVKEIESVCGAIDVVFFTGDLTNRGSETEFLRLDEELHELWQELWPSGSQPTLIAVPGNHDLIRPAQAQADELAKWHEWTTTERDRVLTDLADGKRQVIETAFAPYKNWLNKTPLRGGLTLTPGIFPGDFSVTIEKQGLKLGVVGLNSAYLQLQGGDMMNKLALDVLQLHEACGGDAPRWLRRHDASLLLSHHGPTWLHPNSRKSYFAEIVKPGRFAAHLYGHMHIPVTQVMGWSGSQTRTECQGAALFGLETYEDEQQIEQTRIHGYSAGRIERKQGDVRIRAFPRFWQPKDGVQYRFDRPPNFSLELDGGYAIK